MAEAKILVVEDDPAIRNLIHRFLAKQEYTMESAEDGKKALAILSSLRPTWSFST
jgi:two-component system OmpR family response regulator